MSMHVQCLRDAEEIDDRPLFNFCQWAREKDPHGYFGQHYDWANSQACIMDLGSLHAEIKEAYEGNSPFSPETLSSMPDIRPWLTEQVEKGIVLAYVAW